MAGRLVEQYQRPSFVLTEVENGIYKGSGRSFGDFSLAKALDYAKDTIIGGGGHAGAAGVRLDGKQLYAFREKINEYYRSLHLVDQEKHLRHHADLDVNNLADFSLDLIEELKLLEPFGAGNEEHIFRLQNVEIINTTRMGADRNHLRVDVRDGQGSTLKLVAFFAPDEWLALTTDDHISPLIAISANEFNGVTSVEGRIIDIDML